MDECTPEAQAIGAVNTLVMRQGRLVGENTDAPGFLVDEPLEELGTRLVLPSWIEPDREEVEEALPAIRRGAVVPKFRDISRKNPRAPEKTGSTRAV